MQADPLAILHSIASSLMRPQQDGLMQDAEIDSDYLARARTAAAVLIAARSGDRLGDLPSDCRPRTVDEAYAIQAAVAPHLGPIGGWKVGVHAPGGTPICSPLPRASILAGDKGAAVVSGPSRYRGVEGEMAFRIGQDLAVGAPRDVVERSIASCHLAIEVVETRYTQMDAADFLSVVADLQNHEALVVGAAGPDWRSVAFCSLPVQLWINGSSASAAQGRADDLIELLVWLANTGAAWAGGLKAGDIITTGSWFPKVPAPPKAQAQVMAPEFPAVTVTFCL